MSNIDNRLVEQRLRQQNNDEGSLSSSSPTSGDDERGTGTMGSDEEDNDNGPKLAEKETKNVEHWRIVLVAVLVLTATAICTGTYFLVNGEAAELSVGKIVVAPHRCQHKQLSKSHSLSLFVRLRSFESSPCLPTRSRLHWDIMC